MWATAALGIACALGAWIIVVAGAVIALLLLAAPILVEGSTWAKRLGLTTVVEADGTLVGLISDGDLRRQMERHGNALLDLSAA